MRECFLPVCESRLGHTHTSPDGVRRPRPSRHCVAGRPPSPITVFYVKSEGFTDTVRVTDYSQLLHIRGSVAPLLHSTQANSSARAPPLASADHEYSARLENTKQTQGNERRASKRKHTKARIAQTPNTRTTEQPENTKTRNTAATKTKHERAVFVVRFSEVWCCK